MKLLNVWYAVVHIKGLHKNH